MKKLFKPRFSHRLPKWLKFLGATRVCVDSIEFKWGYLGFFDTPTLTYDYYDDDGVPRINVGIFLISVHIILPFIKTRYDTCEPPAYGIQYHNNIIWLQWGLHTKSFNMPWDLCFIKHEVLAPIGWVAPANDEYYPPYSDNRIVKVYDYTYQTKDGSIQYRKATVCVERREWRQRWLKWFKINRRVCEDIHVTFDGEIGEGCGSWKGGTTGCGYGMLPNETMLDCLRRMERNRVFD